MQEIAQGRAYVQQLEGAIEQAKKWGMLTEELETEKLQLLDAARKKLAMAEGLLTEQQVVSKKEEDKTMEVEENKAGEREAAIVSDKTVEAWEQEAPPPEQSLSDRGSFSKDKYKTGGDESHSGASNEPTNTGSWTEQEKDSFRA
jgi:hypothetical protein